MSLSISLHNVQGLRAEARSRNRTAWIDLYVKTDEGEQCLTLSFWGEGRDVVANAYATAINEAAAAELARKATAAAHTRLHIVAAE